VHGQHLIAVEVDQDVLCPPLEPQNSPPRQALGEAAAELRAAFTDVPDFREQKALE